MGIYFSLANVRSKFNWLLPVTLCAVNFLNAAFLTPPEAEENGRKAMFNMVLQILFNTVAGIFLWVGDHFRERTARRLWLTQRQVAGHSAMLQRLLRLEFPCVVHVVKEQIVATDDFISVFGPDVAYLKDLQTSNEIESSGTGLSGFVAEAKRLGTPVKRRFEFISSGDTNRIDCTVCATLTGFSDEILLGFVVHDSRTIIPRSELRDLFCNDGAHVRGGLHGDLDLDQRDDASQLLMRRVAFSEDSSSGRSRESALGHWKVKPTQVQHVDSSSSTRSSSNGHFGVISATQVSIEFKDSRFNLGEVVCFRKHNTIDMNYLSNCRHPAILLFMGTVTFADGYALIMEPYACSLATLLEEGPVSMTNAVRMVAHISSAVAYLHDRGICHTALRPENIVLMQRVEVDPVAKIANMSQCRRGVFSVPERGATVEEVHLEFKDVVDLAILFIMLITGDFAVETKEDSLPLRDLRDFHPGLASIIKAAMDGDHLSALRFATGIAGVEREIRLVPNLPHIPMALTELNSTGSDLNESSSFRNMTADVNMHRKQTQERQTYCL
jgi:hypothetical protein